MKLQPFNRYLLIEPQVAAQSEDEIPSILVPDGYRPKAAFATAKVMAIAENCKAVSSLAVGDRILYDNSMIQEVKIDGQTYYLLLENYVLCLVS
jgi:co-chaperonin GroES (HSP10)